MDEDVKKKVSIGIAVVCIVFAVAIAYKTYSGGSSGPTNRGPIQMLCVNPECNYAFELSRDEFQKMMAEQTQGGDMMMMQQPVFECPKCKENSAYIAEKCEKCGTVFIPNMEDPESYDKCPECGFSKYEEMRKKKK